VASEMKTEVSTNPGPCERVHTSNVLNSPQASNGKAGNLFQCSRLTGLFLIAALVIFFTNSLTFAQPDQPRSVPAEFVRQLQTQEETNHFRRPSAIFIDRTFDEIFVSDMGRNTVVVFDEYGNQRFAFTGDDHFAVPLDLEVTEDGFIYVLGSTANGRHIFVFDYDGLFLKEIKLVVPDGSIGSVTSFALDSAKNIYLLASTEMQILGFDKDGNYVRTTRIESSSSDSTDSQEVILGSISIVGNRILVPSSMDGNLNVYDLTGRLVAQIGRKGSKAGELNFPVAATIYNNEMYMVLDKHRYNVVCYDLTGKFLGEFGGKGFRNGWFYHPTMIETDNNGHVYVGQIYDGRIQVCDVPEFILQAVASEQTDSETIIGKLNSVDEQATNDNATLLQPAGAQEKEVTTHSLRVTGSPASGDPNR